MQMWTWIWGRHLLSRDTLCCCFLSSPPYAVTLNHSNTLSGDILIVAPWLHAETPRQGRHFWGRVGNHLSHQVPLETLLLFLKYPTLFFFFSSPGVCLRWGGWCLKRKGYGVLGSMPSSATWCWQIYPGNPNLLCVLNLYFHFKNPGLSPSLSSRRTLQMDLLKMLKVNQPTA